MVSAQTGGLKCITMGCKHPNKTNISTFFADYQKKNRRNFIKENIRNAKGCAQCIVERKNSENSWEKREVNIILH